MRLSVIIPTYQAEKLLPALLSRLRAQSIESELIVIDSSSSDRTPQIARETADIFLSIPKETFDHGHTRTIAAQAANGDILVFMTQDAMPCNNKTLERLVGAFDDPSIAAAYGRQIPYEKTSLFGRHLRYFNYPEQSYVRILQDRERYGLKTAFFSDSFGAYRTSVLSEVGWFKKGLIVGEDMHTVAKILRDGYRVAYQAEAAVYHAHSYSVIEDFKRYFDTGVFHSREAWLIDTFGKAGGEGKRYILSELRYIAAQHAYGKIPEFVIRNTLKYLGYTLGVHHKKLPQFLIEKLSMHPSWWYTHAHLDTLTSNAV